MAVSCIRLNDWRAESQAGGPEEEENDGEKPAEGIGSPGEWQRTKNDERKLERRAEKSELFTAVLASGVVDVRRVTVES